MKHMMSVYYGILWYTMVYYGIMIVKSWWDYYGKMIAFDDGCISDAHYRHYRHKV